MPLSSQEKIQLMKQAYSENYKGSFTELFKANDPNWDQDPELAASEMQPLEPPAKSVMDVQVGPDARPPSASLNQQTRERIEQSPAPSQELVQSYGSEELGEMPTGERVETVLENPGQYKDGGTKQEGGYKLDNSYTDNYLKDYLKKEGGYKWDLKKLKASKKT